MFDYRYDQEPSSSTLERIHLFLPVCRQCGYDSRCDTMLSLSSLLLSLLSNHKRRMCCCTLSQKSHAQTKIYFVVRKLNEEILTKNAFAVRICKWSESQIHLKFNLHTRGYLDHESIRKFFEDEIDTHNQQYCEERYEISN